MHEQPTGSDPANPEENTAPPAGPGTAREARLPAAVADRAALGKAARATARRADHAAYAPAADRQDPIALLEAEASVRLPDLVPIRYGRMLASPFAFYRGAAGIMAADLARTPSSGLRVQLCGDAHLANFGGFGSPERDLLFNINDFDETLPGPFEWDVKRLAASAEIAAQDRGCSAKDRRAIVLALVEEYRLAMREFAAMRELAVWYAELDLAAIRARWGAQAHAEVTRGIERGMTLAQKRDNRHALAKLTHRVDGQVCIVSRPPLLVPVEELMPAADPAWIADVVRTWLDRYSRTLLGDRRKLLERFRPVHLARKVVGVGSVGTETWIILLFGRDETDPLFLQVKEARASVLEPYAGKSAYSNHAQRVVEGQRLTQGVTDILLGWDRVQSLYGTVRDHYLRQLWDWKYSADLETIEPAALLVYGRLCGWTLARAHARSGDRVAIAAYLGTGDAFERAIAAFAATYAAQNALDHKALVAAAASGRIKAQTGV